MFYTPGDCLLLKLGQKTPTAANTFIPSLDTSPFTRHTLWSTMVMGVFMVFSFLGVSQPQYQRFASVPTLAQAQLYVRNN